jgi:hypothetical protein
LYVNNFIHVLQMVVGLIYYILYLMSEYKIHLYEA